MEYRRPKLESPCTFGQSLQRFGLMTTNPGHNSHTCGGVSTNIGHSCPMLARCRPTLESLRTYLGGLGQIWNDVHRHWAQVDQFWSVSSQSVPGCFDQIWAISEPSRRTPGVLARRWTDIGEMCAGVRRGGPSSTNIGVISNCVRRLRRNSDRFPPTLD